MDQTNRTIKVCRRLEEIEFVLSLQEGRSQTELDALRDEREELEAELETLQPANGSKL